MLHYNISINKELASIVEQEIKAGKYANRSEFFRDMIRDLFVRKNSLDIEPISKTTTEYREMKKALKNKKDFIPYETVKKNCKLS